MRARAHRRYSTWTCGLTDMLAQRWDAPVAPRQDDALYFHEATTLAFLAA
eukprot:CAMPEP_0182859878 /NCGR_PEP_ID=MMETSP0034_2-20130328/4574_1 /TAXON_ID=156128 /ORGANISM="Nephroselmis pyriformis, Strain CCMP717" /LENGTH=49 /DNA_ID= /DNA_START= /DNA_END= /DNA_ORIENTATION=